jgi:hypothetical protein
LSQSQIFPSSHFSPPTPEAEEGEEDEEGRKNRTSSMIAQAGGRLRRSLTTPRVERRNIPVDEVEEVPAMRCGGCTIA